MSNYILYVCVCEENRNFVLRSMRASALGARAECHLLGHVTIGGNLARDRVDGELGPTVSTHRARENRLPFPVRAR